MPISKETRERIVKEAEAYIDHIHCHVGDMEYEAYIAGATAEAGHAETIIDQAIHKERNAIQGKITEMDVRYTKQVHELKDTLKDIKSYMDGLKSGPNFFLPSLDTFIEKITKALREYEGEGGVDG